MLTMIVCGIRLTEHFYRLGPPKGDGLGPPKPTLPPPNALDDVPNGVGDDCAREPKPDDPNVDVDDDPNV